MWSLEVFALIISMASFAGIVVILAIYDEKPQPGFANSISINTIIAILSTILKATLLFIVSEVMGQLKWQWMETPRPVRDIEYFISAGAGLAGSLKFLFFTWKPILAIIGAVIVIASSAIGPFSQQSSATYPDFTVGSYDAANGSAASYALRMKTAFKPMPKPEDVNRTSKPRIADSLLGQNTTVSMIILTTVGSANGTRIPPADGSIQNLAGYLNTLAVDCTIYPCARNYSGEVVNGAFQENVDFHIALPMVSRMAYRDKTPIEEYYGDFIKFTDPCYSRAGSYSPVMPPDYSTWWDSSNISDAFSQKGSSMNDNWLSWRLNGNMTNVPVECSRMVGSETYGSIQRFIDKNIQGSCNMSGSDVELDQLFKTVDCGDKWWLDSIFKGGNASLETISDAFDGMASAITNIMRTEGFDGRRNPNSFVNGLTSQSAVCIKAYWSWLIYPGSLLVLTAALFMTVYITSILDRRERPVWKSSVLPLIFYDIKSPESPKVGDRKSVSLLQLFELEKVADNTVVRFDNDTDAPGFVKEQCEKDLENTLIHPS
ncbi:hypothetical protein CKAH01_05672 [Colletotrichum kahawae]|uniref:Uncharacterized protein n=1 Tax=Colletotrichum kahawae TaxID=34407 RepID=A0AAD9YBB3_COLKA|nr:hypothetical protein CKAH01_05672 [Colletotrichum kahawae]